MSVSSLPIYLNLSHQLPPKPFFQTVPFPGFQSILPAVDTIQKNVAMSLNSDSSAKGENLLESSTQSTSDLQQQSKKDLEAWKVSPEVSIPPTQPRIDPSLQYLSLVSGLAIQDENNYSTMGLLTKLGNSNQFSSISQLLSSPPSSKQLPQGFVLTMLQTIQKHQNAMKLLTLNCGQSFHCSVNLSNGGSSFSLSNLSVHLELFVSHPGSGFSKQIPKGIKFPEDKVLGPKSNISEKTNFKLSEQGLHVLSCFVSGEITNVNPSGVASPVQPFAIRRLFPFNVIIPISAKNLKIKEIPFKKDCYRVHIDLQNSSSKILQLKSVQFRLKSPKKYTVKDYSTTDGKKIEALKIGEKRSLFFDILSNGEAPSEETHPLEAPSTELGTIVFIYISEMLEQGVLEIPPIKVSESARNHNFPLRVEYQASSTKPIAERPYTISYTISNETDLDMSLVLQFNLQQTFPMIVNGNTYQEIGTLEARTSRMISFNVVFLKPGIIEVGNGVSILDQLSNVTYYFGAPQTGVSSSNTNTCLCLRNLVIFGPRTSDSILGSSSHQEDQN